MAMGGDNGPSVTYTTSHAAGIKVKYVRHQIWSDDPTFTPTPSGTDSPTPTDSGTPTNTPTPTDTPIFTYTPTPTYISANMLTNGDFSSGMTNWTTYESGGANANFSVQSGQLKVQVINSGTYIYDIQVFYENLLIENGKDYRLTFDARSQAARSIIAEVGESDDDFTAYGSDTIDLTTTMTTYSFDFTMTEATDSTARINLQCGLYGSTMYFDNVALYCLTAP